MNFANLRSLGPQGTLILLDDRRIVREPYSGQAVNPEHRADRAAGFRGRIVRRRILDLRFGRDRRG